MTVDKKKSKSISRKIPIKTIRLKKNSKVSANQTKKKRNSKPMSKSLSLELDKTVSRLKKNLKKLEDINRKKSKRKHKL